VAADAAPAERQRAREEVERWRRELLAGADLAALARARSDSETAKFDGLMTPIARGQVPPAVERVVWSLTPGAISEVVETRVGFHVFRLEERLAPETLADKDQKAWARLRLTHEARQEARDRRRRDLLAACGAVEDFARLDDARGGDAVVFRMDTSELRRSDLERERAALPFAERHTRSLAEMARTESWARLVECGARRDGTGRDPSVTDALAAAERRARAELAYARRLEAWSLRQEDATLRAYHSAGAARFATPARVRVRVLVLQAREPADLSRAHDRLQALLPDLRAGRRDLAAAAAGMSDDESAARGGDLGFVMPRDLAAWVGQTALDRILGLADGEIGGPMQVEVYRADRLASVPEGFLLARVEGREAARPRTLEEARADVARSYARDHAMAAREEIRRGLLAELRAEFHVERLAAP
jgi:parvulin-like peptidyl-prolyl isomerase